MSIKELLPQLRHDRGLTQEELAAKLFVTRQAVSRWETGETVPGIDMTKLLATTLQVPLGVLLEAPEHSCQCCGTPFSVPHMDMGTNADGSINTDYCKWCYDKGEFTYKSIDEVIETSAPYLMEASGMDLDEAVSFMGAMLPNLKHWKDPYEQEAREKYGDEAVDATQARLGNLTPDEQKSLALLEESIKVQLRLAMASGNPASDESAELAHMHQRWIKAHWGAGNYSKEAHLGLANGYLADQRFIDYYDKACGEGACEFLVEALKVML